MSLRVRLVAGLAALAAVLSAVGAWLAYDAARSEMRTQVDAFLTDRAADFLLGRRAALGAPRPGPRRATERTVVALADPDTTVQLVSGDGSVDGPYGPDELPVDERILALARGTGRPVLDDVTSTSHLRVVSLALPNGEVVQIGRSLEETDRALAGILHRLVVAGVAASAIAAGAGWLIAHRLTGPLVRLSRAADEVARTHELRAPVAIERADEVGRVAASFNTMVAALATSRRQQQRLVRDASHELRTPLTSLRTNIELLQRATTLSASERDEVIDDVHAELVSLEDLVTELVDLATDRFVDEPVGDVALDELVAGVVDRARRRSGRAIDLAASPSLVAGRPSGLDRAVANLLDNALKFSEPGTPVHVTVADGSVSVRDLGAGIPPDDLPRVFDRFHRAVTARGTPGSGLGLAIVQRVAEEHGGEVFAWNCAEGGAEVGFRVPAKVTILTELSRSSGQALTRDLDARPTG